MPISYNNVIKPQFNKINLNIIKNKPLIQLNKNGLPYYIIYNHKKNKKNIYCINTTNPLNKIKLYTISKYCKQSTKHKSELSIIKNNNSYEYNNIEPNFITNSTQDISIKDNNNVKVLNFNKFSPIKSKNLIPHIFSKNTSLKLLHKQLININTIFNFNLKNIYNSSPKQLQFIIKFIKFYNKFTNLKYKFPYSNGLLNNLFSESKAPNKALDITSGLQAIDSIFESRTTNESNYLISKDLSILNKNLNQIYDISKQQFITYSFLHSIECKNFNWIYTLSNYPVYNLESYSSIIYGGQIITTGNYSPSNLINSFYNSKLRIDKQYNSSKQSLFFAMNLILESLINQYLYQGISLPSIHFEIMAKKMTSCVKIKYPGDLTVVSGDKLPLTVVEMLNISCKLNGFSMCTYEPIILGITKSTLANSGFLSSISFQETLKLLSNLALQQSVDWLSDLKSKLISTDLIPSGIGWWRYFNKL
nr:RNA polymerase subunit beta' [Coccidia sp. AB-2023a]